MGESKPGDEPDQIADQDEDKEDREKGRVGLDVVSDDFLALPQHESLDAFKAVLQSAGRFHRESRSHEHEHNQQEDERPAVPSRKHW